MTWPRGLAFALGWLTACSTPAPTNPRGANLTAQVVEPNEQTHVVGDLAARHAFTVLMFYSATCPTVTAHDARLKALWSDYHARNIGVYAVASEADITVETLGREASRRGYPFPLVWDAGGRLARQLNVRYASQVVVLGADASVVYAGSIDSDRRFLHDDATPYLRNALDALLRGFAPAKTDGAAYGCALSL